VNFRFSIFDFRFWIESRLRRRRVCPQSAFRNPKSAILPAASLTHPCPSVFIGGETTAYCVLRTAYNPPPAGNYHLPTTNWQLATGNWQLPRIRAHRCSSVANFLGGRCPPY